MIRRRGLLVLVCLFSFACTRKPKTPRDQVSYAIGIQFGRSLKSQNLDLNPKAVSEGMKDALTGERPWLTDEEMQSALAALGAKHQEEAKAEATKNKKGADDFLTTNKTAEGVKTTASGLQYKITKEGEGAQPKIDDVVVVHFRGTLLDGTEFDSSYKRKTPAEFPVRNVIPGWSEGIQLMKKGGAATFYVPPALGYGDRQRQQIPPNAVLTFEVELLDVKHPPKAPPAHKK